VKADFQKVRRAQKPEPLEMVCDIATGGWGMVTSAPLTERQEWLLSEATILLGSQPRASIYDLRERYMSEFSRDPRRGSARMLWKRDLDSLSRVTSSRLRTDGEYFWMAEKYSG
jgi:hypothetical protein